MTDAFPTVCPSCGHAGSFHTRCVDRWYCRKCGHKWGAGPPGAPRCPDCGGPMTPAATTRWRGWRCLDCEHCTAHPNGRPAVIQRPHQEHGSEPGVHVCLSCDVPGGCVGVSHYRCPLRKWKEREAR